MPKHNSHVPLHRAARLSDLERSTANCAGVISAYACKGADWRYTERTTYVSDANNAALYMQMYLLVDTLGWPLHRAKLVSPFTVAEIADIVAEVNVQRHRDDVEAQLERAEVMMLECVCNIGAAWRS